MFVHACVHSYIMYLCTYNVYIYSYTHNIYISTKKRMPETYLITNFSRTKRNDMERCRWWSRTRSLMKESLHDILDLAD